MSCNQPCEVCRARIATCSCTKTVQHYAVCHTYDLRHGDLVCRISEWRPRPGTTSRVYEIEAIDNVNFAITLVIRRATGHGTVKQIQRVAHSLLRRAVDVPCGTALCDQCAQDPGEPHRYCPAHYLGRELGGEGEKTS